MLESRTEQIEERRQLVKERQEESLRHREQLLRELEIANQLTQRDLKKAEEEKEQLKLDLRQQVNFALISVSFIKVLNYIDEPTVSHSVFNVRESCHWTYKSCFVGEILFLQIYFIADAKVLLKLVCEFLKKNPATEFYDY